MLAVIRSSIPELLDLRSEVSTVGMDMNKLRHEVGYIRTSVANRMDSIRNRNGVSNGTGPSTSKTHLDV